MMIIPQNPALEALKDVEKGEGQPKNVCESKIQSYKRSRRDNESFQISIIQKKNTFHLPRMLVDTLSIERRRLSDIMGTIRSMNAESVNMTVSVFPQPLQINL